MEKFIIKGGNKLKGKVSVSGAKNSSLALMPATLLNSGKNILSNTPRVNDIFTMIKLLKHLGVEANFENDILELNTSGINSQIAPYEHVKKMRASVYVLGPLLSRYGFAKVSLPGGCAWGPRPINLHLEALKKMGATIEIEEGYIVANAKKLHGADIHFDISSVGATGNVIMAASLADGVTRITNAAIEPEITQLAEYLQLMGAQIEGIGSANMKITGVDELKAASIRNISDRIEAGTLLIAGAITHGNIELEYHEQEHLNAVIWKLEDCGYKIHQTDTVISLNAEGIRPKSVDITTAIYPGFPTDMQAQWTALMCLADGTSTITDTIYFDRFKHVQELNRLGADILNIHNTAKVKGIDHFSGAKVMSTDLRASASLVLAGLAAKGTTDVLRIYHLDRGYQKIEEKLRLLGADIERVNGEEY